MNAQPIVEETIWTDAICPAGSHGKDSGDWEADGAGEVSTGPAFEVRRGDAVHAAMLTIAIATTDIRKDVRFITTP